jgi:hypothetical protein
MWRKRETAVVIWIIIHCPAIYRRVPSICNLFIILKLSIPCIFLSSYLPIIPTKWTFLISTNIKPASPTNFGTYAPYLLQGGRDAIGNNDVRQTLLTRGVRKISSHFEYLENRSRGLDVTWQPVRGDLTVHPWTVTLQWGLVSRKWDAVDWACVLCDRRIHKSPPFQRRF